MRVCAASAVVVLSGLVLVGCASGQSTGGSVPSGAGPVASKTTTGPGMGGTASGGVPSPAATSSAGVAAIAATCPSVQSFAVLNGPSARPVPADIKVAWVLRCSIVSKGAGPRLLVAERSVTDPAALVAALKVSSVPRAKVVCPMLRVLIPYFALVQNDGQVFVPAVPLNNCGMAQLAVTQALNSLRFTELSSRPLN